MKSFCRYTCCIYVLSEDMICECMCVCTRMRCCIGCKSLMSTRIVRIKFYICVYDKIVMKYIEKH